MVALLESCLVVEAFWGVRLLSLQGVKRCWFVVSPRSRWLAYGCVSGVRCKLDVVHTLFHSLIKFVSNLSSKKSVPQRFAITRSLGFSGLPGRLLQILGAQRGTKKRRQIPKLVVCPLSPHGDQRRCSDVWVCVPLAVVPLAWRMCYCSYPGGLSENSFCDPRCEMVR